MNRACIQAIARRNLRYLYYFQILLAQVSEETDTHIIQLGLI